MFKMLLIFTLCLNANLVFAKKTDAEKAADKAAKEQRKKERKEKKEAAKLTFGIDKGESKWKCKKGLGTQSRSDCKSSLKQECSGKTGWKSSGSSCKKEKLFAIKTAGSNFKCKKDSSGTFTKDNCISELTKICPSKGAGYAMKGKSCKKAKLF